MGVCRRILRHAHDAEDAFQATFVVLARKAARIVDREAVGSWLYGVAYRAALGARASELRRKAKEQQVGDMPHPLVVTEEGQAELLAVLDRELARLPEKYRIAVVLCELEGRGRKATAGQLGLPEGTLSSRLAAARKMLARRMASHGAAVTGASVTALLASEAGAACIPAPLVASTIRAVGGVVPAGVAALAEGVLKAMLLTKIKGAALVLLLAASVSFGTVGFTYRTAMAQTGPGPQNAAEAQEWANQPPPAGKAARVEKDELASLRLQVEALRVSLQATNQRIKALEAAEQARHMPGGGLPGAALGGGLVEPAAPAAVIGAAPPGATPAPGAALPSVTPAPGAAPTPELRVPQATPGSNNGPRQSAVIDANATYGETPSPALSGNKTASKAGGQAALVAEIDAVAKKLAQDPKNKEALDELDRAVKKLKRLNEPKQPSELPR